jgi:4-carboxymuconolactone decarboxylase
MPRLAPITGKSDVPAEHHAVVDAVVKVFGGVRGPFSMLLHSPKLAERVLGLVGFFRDESVVEAKLRSIAILTAVREREAAYVWAAQVAAARRNGLRDEAIDLIRAQGDPGMLSAEEREIVTYVRQLMRTNRADQAAFDALEAARRAVAGRADGHGELFRVPVGRRQRLRGRAAGGRRPAAGVIGHEILGHGPAKIVVLTPAYLVTRIGRFVARHARA